MLASHTGLKLSKIAIKAFSFILHNQPVTKAQLCSYVGIGPSSISKYVVELMDKNLIEEAGEEASTGGRRPILYKVKANSYYILCVNLSTIYVEVAIADFSLHLLKIKHFDISQEENPDNIIKCIGEAYTQFKKDFNLSDSSFWGAGVTLFGEPTDESGVIYEPITPKADFKWSDYPIIKKMRSVINLPIFVEKGITATAGLESNFGSGKRSRSMLYILCATRIRSAFVYDGFVQGESPYYEDAFGHMVINFDGPLCDCGQNGCLNSYASIPVALNMFSSRIQSGVSSMFSGDSSKVTIEELCSLASTGDECAIDVISDCAKIFGIALANYVNVTNPSKVVIAGLFVELSDLYFEVAVKEAKEHLIKTKNLYTDFIKLGSFSHPLTTSCASLVLEKFFS